MKGTFTFMPAGGGLTLALNGAPFLSFSGVSVRYATGYEELPELRCTQNEPDRARFVALCRKGSRLTLTFSRQNGLISLDADYEGIPLAGESSVRIYLSFQGVKNMIAGGLIRIPWWSFPCYESDPELWPDRKVGVVQFERAGTHFLFLPLPGNDFSSYLYKGYLTLTTGKAGLTELHGTCLQINGADDPYSAATDGYRAAKEAGRISVPLRDERKIPSFVDTLGWCSWNAMYKDVSEEGLVAKAKEFKEKNIPVRWMLIDDGWQDRNDCWIKSIDANKEHFPNGLKHAVDAVKAANPDVKVGLWITFNVYWHGFEKDAPIVTEWADVLDQIVVDGEVQTVIPALDPERGKRFWERYFEFLRSCGIEFLKIDNQSSYMTELSGTAPHFSQTKAAHAAVEAAAEQFFSPDGSIWIINCMGMAQENVFSRPKTAISRNSDDFYPNKPRNFDTHVVQNAWNAVWHGQVYLPDFDMWTTHHVDAKKSAVLRAISGGPVYTADAVGETEDEYLRPLCDAEGRVYRFPGSAQPTADLFYTDCRAEKCPVKIFNRAGDNFALAVFPMSEEPSDFTVRPGDIPETDPEASYLVYEFFSKTWTRLDPDGALTGSVQGDDALAFSLFKITDGAIDAGDLSAFFPVVAGKTGKKPITEYLG